MRILALVAICLVGAVAQAEDGTRGRLPDGRAYRVDPQGNEIVDYIAELEISNEALNRRIRGLEGEVSEKQAQLERLQRAVPAPTVAERTITAAEKSAQAASAQTKVELARREEQLREVKETHASEMNALRAELEAAQSEATRRANEVVALKSARLEKASNDAEREAASLKSKISELEEQIAAKNAEIDGLYSKVTQITAAHERTELERVRLSDTISEITTRLDERGQELADARQEIVKLTDSKSEALDSKEVQLASMQSEISNRDVEIRSLRERLSVSESRMVAARGDTSQASQGRSAEDSAATGSSQMGQSRTRAIEALKGRLVTQANAAKAMVARRDVQYAAYLKRAGPQVRFKPTQALSSRGLSVQEILGRLKAVTSVVELSSISRDIGEIEAKMEEDLKLIERIGQKKR